MRIGDLWEYSVGHLFHRKLRSWLTVIGILLGIATIVVLVSIGDGVSMSISESLDAFGADMVTITPGGGFAFRNMEDVDSDYGKLYEKDASKARRVMGVSDVSMSVSSNVDISFADKETAASVTATESNIFSMFPSSYPLEKGRYFSDSEQKVAVIGYGVANDMFGSDEVEVNSYIYLEDGRYKVVGILEETGSMFSGAGDNAIYVPFEDKDSLFSEDDLSEGEIGEITIKVYEGTNTTEVGEGITSLLALSHGVDEDNPDFTVTTSESTQERISEVTDTLGTALLLIGLISALVGGIGVANTMYMSVVERTKEVGILKSIGATSFQILILFITEAAMVGAIGGIMGFLLGAGVIQLITCFGLTPYLRLEVGLGAILFSTFVGIAAGALPARSAAKIPAIEALSYD